METLKIRLKILWKRLFFYSSRQLLRRRRSYLMIFLTSVVLLGLVMTFLEMAESTYLREVEIARSGTYHASFLSLREDYTEEFLLHSKVETAYAIPYTSMMASSDDATKPAKMTVETDEIDEYLNVRYVWGRPPEDGEIAVSADLYKAYGYLTAGTENELFFSATRMTYFPLTISGIFACSDASANYAFVSEKTLAQIDAETGAKTKYDHFIRCDHASNKYIAVVVEDLWQRNKLYETDEQKLLPRPESRDMTGGATTVYKNYLNKLYIHTQQTQDVTPLVTISMPVIIVAALMMASFMTNWFAANAGEYGILGAIGANRRQLCTISAGQILLIGLVAAVPVILFSSLVANIYISVYNSALSSDVDYIYSVPWLKLIEAALWWNILSCFFSYIGIARLTMEAPYILISGSFRSRMPFVKATDRKLLTAKDKLRRLSHVRAMRQIKSGLLSAGITSLVCAVSGIFVFLLVIHQGEASAIFSNLKQYNADMTVRVVDDSMTNYNRTAWITADNIRELESIDGIAEVAIIRFLEPERASSSYADAKGELVQHSVTHLPNGSTQDAESMHAIVVNEEALHRLTDVVIEGNPDDLFTKERQLVLVESPYAARSFSVGDTVLLSGEQIRRYDKNGRQTSITYNNQVEFTVAAIVKGDEEFRDFGNYTAASLFAMTDAGVEALGVAEPGNYSRANIWFEEGLPESEMVAISERIAATPAFMRFELMYIAMRTDSEKQINTATTVMYAFFFGMLYLSLVSMYFVDASLKVTKMRGEIAVLRQVGAQEEKIYRSLRLETYLPSVISLIVVIVVIAAIAYAYVSVELYYLYVYSDMYPWAYTPELIAELKREIQEKGLLILSLLIPIIPLELIAGALRAVATIPPTKRILRETITEGLRKDTD